MSAGTPEPLVIHGWTVFAHPLFLAQMEVPVRQVETLKQKDPVGYVKKNASKRLAAITKLAFNALPQDPMRPEYRQGGTLGGDLKRADEIDCFGQRAGYAADPQESINFATSHDNETLFDAGIDPVRFPFLEWQGQPFVLHPVQAGSSDPLTRDSSFDADTGELFVPARTTAVFVSPRPAAQRIELLIADVQHLLEEGVLNVGQANSLVAKLESALNQAHAGKNGPAANTLRAFVQEAAALVRLDVLRQEAKEVQALLGSQ